MTGLLRKDIPELQPHALFVQCVVKRSETEVSSLLVPYPAFSQQSNLHSCLMFLGGTSCAMIKYELKDTQGLAPLMTTSRATD
jgi:hypothetical protein